MTEPSPPRVNSDFMSFSAPRSFRTTKMMSVFAGTDLRSDAATFPRAQSTVHSMSDPQCDKS